MSALSATLQEMRQGALPKPRLLPLPRWIVRRSSCKPMVKPGAAIQI